MTADQRPPAPAPTGAGAPGHIDRDAVLGGDGITWRTFTDGTELTGTVEYAVCDAVHVTYLGRRYRIPWCRVTGHRPRNR